MRRTRWERIRVNYRAQGRHDWQPAIKAPPNGGQAVDMVDFEA
jgi:hypothetical protein